MLLRVYFQRNAPKNRQETLRKKSLLTSPTHTNTPDRLFDVLLLSSETSVLLLVGFDCLLPGGQFIFLYSRSLLRLSQVVAESVDALLIVVEFSQAQLQSVLVKVVHQCLVLLGLEKREVKGDIYSQEKLRPPDKFSRC